LAIVLTNIYMAEKNDWPLRKDHQDIQPLGDDRATSAGFLDDVRNLGLMTKMDQSNPNLFSRIASLALAHPTSADYEDEDSDIKNPWGRVPTDPIATAARAAALGIVDPWAGTPGSFNPIRLYRDKKAYFRAQLPRRIADQFGKPFFDTVLCVNG